MHHYFRKALSRPRIQLLYGQSMLCFFSNSFSHVLLFWDYKGLTEIRKTTKARAGGGLFWSLGLFGYGKPMRLLQPVLGGGGCCWSLETIWAWQKANTTAFSATGHESCSCCLGLKQNTRAASTMLFIFGELLGSGRKQNTGIASARLLLLLWGLLWSGRK